MTQLLSNRELYFRDPTTLELLNNGVSKVSEIGEDVGQIKTLRFELQNFVCDGEYARELERILRAYLDGDSLSLNRTPPGSVVALPGEVKSTPASPGRRHREPRQ